MFDFIASLGESVTWLAPLTFSFLGGIVSLAFQPILARFNQQLLLSGRAWERIQDLRLDAYLTLLDFANKASTTLPTGRHKDGHVQTIPNYLTSRDSFDGFCSTSLANLGRIDDWIDGPTRQHARYVTDYLMNLKIAVHSTPEDELETLALAVKPDLIQISVLTRGKAHQFFKRIDRRSFRYRGNGKYPLRKTHRLLKSTELVKWMDQKGLLLKAGDTLPFAEQGSNQP